MSRCKDDFYHESSVRIVGNRSHNERIGTDKIKCIQIIDNTTVPPSSHLNLGTKFLTLQIFSIKIILYTGVMS